MLAHGIRDDRFCFLCGSAKVFRSVHELALFIGVSAMHGSTIPGRANSCWRARAIVLAFVCRTLGHVSGLRTPVFLFYFFQLRRLLMQGFWIGDIIGTCSMVSVPPMYVIAILRDDVTCVSDEVYTGILLESGILLLRARINIGSQRRQCVTSGGHRRNM